MEGRGRNVFDTMAFLDLDYLYGASMYQWPVDCVMDESLEIAMNYLSRTGQAVNFMAVQNAAAEAIITAWQGGVRHKIRLANYAIRAVETRAAEPTQVQSVYPRVM
jgi:ribosomal protein S7